VPCSIASFSENPADLWPRCRLSNIGFAQERAFVFRTKRTTHGSINTRKLRVFKRPDGIYGIAALAARRCGLIEGSRRSEAKAATRSALNKM
jgi:hypothetical protein